MNDSLGIVCRDKGHVHTRASDPGPELMRVGSGSEVLFILAQRNLSTFNPHR